MPSAQAKFALFLMNWMVSRWTKGDLPERRARQERYQRLNRPPAGLHYSTVLTPQLLAEWISLPGEPARQVILYLHGGAYHLGSINSHRELVGRLVKTSGLNALLLDYRLAPEHPYPAALEDAVAAYDWLLAQGYQPQQIVFAGDSAGGGLALATLVYLRDAGQPLPAAAICISPWTDLTLSGASMESKAAVDRICPPHFLREASRWYAGSYDLHTPLISPLYADLRGLPALMIHVGTQETLLDDSTRLAAQARQAGVIVDLTIWDGLFHVFPIAGMLPEARQVLAQIKAFIDLHIAL